MIVGPKDVSQAQQVIGSWIKKYTNQTINWLNASSFLSDTYRLDLSSQNSAAEFASAFPTIITTINSTKSPSSTPTTAPTPSTRKPPPSKNAWKTLSYLEQEEKLQTTTDTATTTTEVSSSASHHTVHDQHDDINILRARLNDTDD